MFVRSLNRLYFVVATMMFAMLLMSPQSHAADDPRTAIQGHWLTEPKDGIIQISINTDGTYEGRIVGGNNPGRLDGNNPNPEKRGQVLRGQLIMRGLRYDGDGEWSGGTIYDPDSGSTYKCKLVLHDDGTLKVRGYIGISLLGKTQIWTRYNGASLDLPKS